MGLIIFEKSKAQQIIYVFKQLNKKTGISRFCVIV